MRKPSYYVPNDSGTITMAWHHRGDFGLELDLEEWVKSGQWCWGFCAPLAGERAKYSGVKIHLRPPRGSWLLIHSFITSVRKSSENRRDSEYTGLVSSAFTRLLLSVIFWLVNLNAVPLIQFLAMRLDWIEFPLCPNYQYHMTSW